MTPAPATAEMVARFAPPPVPDWSPPDVRIRGVPVRYSQMDPATMGRLYALSQRAIRTAGEVWSLANSAFRPRFREAKHCAGRFAVYRWLRDQGATLGAVAEIMDRRCHGTVHNGIRKCEGLCATSPTYAAKWEEFNRRMAE